MNRAADAEKELREIFRNGRISLFVGFLAVAALLGITELLSLAGGDSTTVSAITETIIIVYWVILWRPAELLLYEHFPARLEAAHSKRSGLLPRR